LAGHVDIEREWEDAVRAERMTLDRGVAGKLPNRVHSRVAENAAAAEISSQIPDETPIGSKLSGISKIAIHGGAKNSTP